MPFKSWPISPQEGAILAVHKDLRLLIVDNSAERAERLSAAVNGAGFQGVTPAANRETMGQALKQSHFDLVLAGHDTPGSDGLDALKLLIAAKINIPLVLYSERGPDERAIEAIRLGARDFVSAHDISRLATVVERELRAREQRELATDCHEMFDASPLPLWVYDPLTLQFLEVNRAAAEHYGYSREEFLSMTLAQIRPPEDVSRLKDFVRMIGDGVVDAGIWRHYKKDGTLIQAEVYVQKMNFRGRPSEMAMIVDVTDRYRRQQDMAAQARIAGLITETGMVLSWARSVREGLQGCTEIVRRQVDTVCAQIWILNEAEAVLEMDAGTGSCTFSSRRIAMGESEIGRVAWERKPFARFEPSREPVCGKACPESSCLQAFAAHPLMVEDRLVGVLAAYSHRPFDRGAMQALASVAGGVAQFIERKRAEEALRESEEQVRLLLDSITEGIYGVDVNGVCTLANRSCVELLGYQRASQLIGKKMHDVFHRAHPDESEAECHFAGAYRNGEVVQMEDQVVWRSDGTSFPAAVRLYPVKKGGETAGAVVTFTDVTERKHAQDEQRKLASIVESSDDFVAVASPAGELMYLNPGGCRMIGLENAQPVIGLHVSRLHPPSTAPRIEREVMPAAARTGSWKGEFQLRHWITGAPIDVSMNAFIVRDPKTGEVLCLATVIRDISDRKRAEDEQRKLASIVESSEDFIGVATPEGEIVYINPGGCRMVGVDDWREFEGKPISDMFPSSVHGWLRDEMLPALLANGRWEGETQFRSPKTGAVVDVSCRNFVVKQPETGEPICIATVTRDIRQRKQVERTLVRAKEAAEAANRAKSEFLANMSHEIRTPMNGIIGMTELALQTDLNPEQRDYLESVRKSADYLLWIINEVLDFSKIEAGKMSLDPSEFALHQSIEETMKSLALRAHQKGLELLCRIAPDVPRFVLADSYRLRQILINLLGNAIKFTERGEVLLDVKLDSSRDSQVTLQFSVRDTGPGIDADKQQLVFEAFTQADGSVTRRFGGTGLGLAISRHLVRLMGGRMWLESEPGKGSTFFFTVQARIGDSMAVPVSPPVEEGGGLLRGIRVLIVDDNATNRRILEQHLAQWGMIAASASGAAGGLALMLDEKSAGREFALVLVDARMPETDGFSLARSIRSHPGLSGAAIMMLSSEDLHSDAQKCREARIDVYMVKPVTQHDLHSAILRVLKTGPAPELRILASSVAASQSAPGLQVLLAEDNAVNQKLAKRLLEKRGHRVTVAGDGRRAVEEHARQRFDVILMDLQMPEVGGLEATRLIRDRERGTGLRVPIIALTAHALKGDRERCLEAGMDDYVSKPIEPDQLFDTIERVTGGRVSLNTR